MRVLYMTPPQLGVSSIGLEATDINNSCIWLGKFEPFSLPASALNEFAEQRNHYIVHTLLPRLDKIRERGLNDRGYYISNINLSMRKNLPESNEPLKNFREDTYNHSLLYPTARKYNLKYNKTESIFVTPTLDIYLKHFINSYEHRTGLEKSYTPDVEGWKKWISHNQVICTKFFFHPLDAYLPFEAFKRHAYIVGGSGSGKSELIKLIIHKQITSIKAGKNKSSAIVIDPHGDLVEEIARFKECKDNEDIIVFDPTLYKDKTPCINIFSPPDHSNETIDTLAQNLTNAFSEIVAETSISSQMKTLLIPCISVLLHRRGSDLGDLQRFMLSEHNEDLVELGIQSKNKGHSDFFRYGFNEKNFDVTKKSIYTRLQALRNSTAFRLMLRTNSTLNLEKQLNSGKIILFNLSKSALGDDVSSAYGRLIVALVKSMGFRRQQIAKSQRTPTFIYIDECQNYVGESIETTLTELRKYGIHLILANQVLGQNMTTQLVDIILSNTSVKFVGKNGSKTLKRMAVETKADIEELEKLTTAHFYCKVNTNKPTVPFKFKAPSHLVGNRNSMDFEDWKTQKKKGWIGYLKNKEEQTNNQTEQVKFWVHLHKGTKPTTGFKDSEVV